jgi:multimeric flavodoxin WrbA
MVEVSVKGIIGSTRSGGNTEIMVKEALEGAREIDGVSVELIYLGRYNIRPCNVCDPKACPPRDGYCVIRDDMTQVIYDKLLKADALVIGAPSYFGSVPSKLKAFLDRTRPFFHCEEYLGRVAPLNLKVAGAVSVGEARFGGQHLVIQSIHTFCLQHGMIVVGGDPLHWDVCGVAHDIGEIYQDQEALKGARILGRRVAEVAQAVKSLCV